MQDCVVTNICSTNMNYKYLVSAVFVYGQSDLSYIVNTSGTV